MDMEYAFITTDTPVEEIKSFEIPEEWYEMAWDDVDLQKDIQIVEAMIQEVIKAKEGSYEGPLSLEKLVFTYNMNLNYLLKAL
jgi:hypothetical protein